MWLYGIFFLLPPAFILLILHQTLVEEQLRQLLSVVLKQQCKNAHLQVKKCI